MVIIFQLEGRFHHEFFAEHVFHVHNKRARGCPVWINSAYALDFTHFFVINIEENKYFFNCFDVSLELLVGSPRGVLRTLMRTPRLLEDRTSGAVSIFLPLFTAPSDAAKFCGFVFFTSMSPCFTVSIRAFDLVIISVSVFIWFLSSTSWVSILVKSFFWSVFGSCSFLFTH